MLRELSFEFRDLVRVRSMEDVAAKVKFDPKELIVYQAHQPRMRNGGRKGMRRLIRQWHQAIGRSNQLFNMYKTRR